MSLERRLSILNILKENTNEDKGITIKELIEKLAEKDGIKLSRNTIKGDLEALKSSNYDIREVKGRRNISKYYYEGEFTLTELRIILDSINSNKYCPNDVRDKIKEKFLNSISIEKRKLVKSIVKTDNSYLDGINILNSMEVLNNAINSRAYVSFYSYTRDEDLKLVENRQVIDFIPKEIYYCNDRYYLVGIGDEKFRHYRIDRIGSLEMGEFHNNKIVVDLKEYHIKNFDMFYSKEIETVEFIVKESLINSVIEKFQDSCRIYKLMDNTKEFRVAIETGINTGLLRWILKQRADIKVTYPDKLIERINRELNNMKSLYKSKQRL